MKLILLLENGELVGFVLLVIYTKKIEFKGREDPEFTQVDRDLYFENVEYVMEKGI